ncbi:nuclear transport factor 2 family protein [Shewanella corallii]|uniref:Nuclear transport factor 2 family protein n=1 Tax=Shewanella corallii TaxID=560080 RepID=A0ABT0NF72_9GAMM|nr:nuclear transport factor 2 family protein [Shewanella corallii]MCL2916516.1 nuclear transport factor 2 family protein [Shewanella corallii]
MTNSTLSNKDKAIALITSIETGDTAPVAFINPDKYIQHNLAVADGLQGFGEVLQALPEGSARARVQRAFTDGDYVVLHTEYNFFGPKSGFDVFRFEDGQIVEHWDNLQELAAPNPSGRTMVDGTTQVTDLDKTQANKEMVSDFVNVILMEGDMSRIGEYVDPEESAYLQHNPMVADGLAGLGVALQALADKGMPMVYTAVHKVLGQGNMVLAISEGQFLGQHVSFYDLFRVADGKVVEHWDTIEVIPPESEWKNSNGKFGY